jgi:D-psicose/D-tagatose/L-ribulose 3-epimerase
MASARPIYFSFFMFDTNARLHDADARARMIRHMQALSEMGYTGFELHIGREPETGQAFPTYEDEVAAYAAFRQEVDRAGLQDIAMATNIGGSPGLDPSSPDAHIEEAGLAFLKSRVDITAALGGSIMMGPVVYPYGAFQEGIWSDALQDFLDQHYDNAAPVLEELGRHARSKRVNVAIEPITHWETPGPNTLTQTIAFLHKVPSQEIGVVIDSAHETLDGAGAEVFESQVQWLADAGRLHYVQASPPGRGDLSVSWLPWQSFFRPVLAHYDGPVAIEIFNALPQFAPALRLSRRKYWIPGVDTSNRYPSAYDVARASLDKLKKEFSKLGEEKHKETPCLMMQN